jgi:hypothetical protein
MSTHQHANTIINMPHPAHRDINTSTVSTTTPIVDGTDKKMINFPNLFPPDIFCALCKGFAARPKIASLRSFDKPPKMFRRAAFTQISSALKVSATFPN